jgi:RNA polymerase sigma-70 factor (ECF subfamily)
MGKSDADLMMEFQRGREEAFGELVARYKLPLLNFFYKLLWDRQLSEDCCQEVFCRIFRHRDRYVPSASFATYLYRIGRNLWIDRYRARKHKPQAASLDASVDDDGHSIGGLVAGDGKDPSYGAELADEFDRVRQALDALPPDLRDTLILVKYQGLKYAEAAETLDVPIGTIRSRIHAAIGQLRQLLRVNVDV